MASGMGTITHAFMVTLTSGGSVSTISYAQNIGSDTYQYKSSCDINDCSGITINAGAKTIAVNNVAVPTGGAGLESAAITLNGTLSYASAVLPAPSTDSSLVGTWKAACYTYGNNYATATINATDATNASLTREMYDNNLCSGSPTMVINLTIVYAFGNTFTASGVNAKELDYTVTEENGVVDPPPVTMFDLAYVDSSNVLYFGLIDTTHDATSPSGRPATVDFSVQYVKQ